MPKLDFKELKRLYALGFALHWIKPRSKMPVNAGWTKGERLTWEELKRTHREDYNVGVRLGFASKIGRHYLAVIDVDIKSKEPRHREEAEAKLKELFPHIDSCPKVSSGRGNGSAHYYVVLETPVRGDDRKAQSSEQVSVYLPSVHPSKNDEAHLSADELADGYRRRAAWEISLLSEGRQVVLPGSVHPDSGKHYEWERPVKEPLLCIKTPETPVSGALSTKVEGESGKKKYRFPNVIVESLGLKPEHLQMLVSGEGVEDRSASCFAVTMAMLKRDTPDDYIISVFTDKEFFLGCTAFDHAKTTDRNRAAYWFEKYCLEPAKRKVSETAFDNEVTEEKEEKEEKGSGDLHKALGFSFDWQKELDLQKGPSGALPTVKPTFKNVRLILENEVDANLLKRNLFANEDHWDTDTPWGYKKGRKRSGNIDDALQVKAWLIDSAYHVEVSVSIIDEVLNFFASNNAFHPVKDFLALLEWDGVPRCEDAFRDYLGANMPEPYQSEVCRKFFIALIKRIYEPGCKFDHMVVLEGKQGVGKSTFGRYLVGDNWFMDGLPEVQDKDAALNLQGIWLCEFSELASIYRSANEPTKAFISRQVDKVRPPYGQRRVDLPRSTVFLGTTNSRDYLTDPTGNRRFWPIEIDRCDFKALRKDREQLLAEAKFYYENFEEPLYLEGEALTQAEEVQESRRVEDEQDAMATDFLAWLELKPEDRQGFDLNELNLKDLFDRGPFMGFNNTPSNRRSAGNVLRKAGYHKIHTRHGKKWKPV